jgi:hypothetical protein
MLKSMSKKIALIMMIALVGVSATFAAGALTLQARDTQVSVGEPVIFDVFLQNDDPYSAYQLQIDLASEEGVVLTNPSFEVGTEWTKGNAAQYGPVQVLSDIVENRITIQSSLIGVGSEVAFPEGNAQILGTLTAIASSEGTLTAGIVNPRFFSNGLEEPEGTSGDVIITDPISVIIGGDVPVIGDVNGDGELKVSDLAMLKAFLAQVIPALPNPGNGDINGDGKLSVADAAMMQAILAGVIPNPNISGKVAKPTRFNPFQVSELNTAVIVDGGPFSAGDTITAIVYANVSTSVVTGYDYTITYDPAVLSLQGGVAPGKAITDGFLDNPTPNLSTPGTIIFVGTSSFADLTQPTGIVEFVKLTFTVLDDSSPSTNIAVSNVDISDSQFMTVNVTPLTTTVDFAGAVEPTPTETPTEVPTPTNTPEPTATPESATPTPIEVPTDTPEPTATPESATPTPTEVPTNTPEPTATPESATPTPTEVPTNTPEPTATPESATPTPTEVPTNTPEPTATPESATPTPVEVPTPTETPTEVPTPTNTPEPTATPESATPTPVEVPTPTETPTEVPTPTNTPEPTATEVPTPVDTPTEVPTPVDTPTEEPSPTPTVTPTEVPTPTFTPTPEGPVSVGDDSGLVVLNHTGIIMQRGTKTGSEFDTEAFPGQPVDLEIIGNQPVVLMTSGTVWPSSAQKGDALVIADALDLEPLANGDGYLIIDRLGNVYAAGTAVHQGDAVFNQTIQFGRYNVTSRVPIAVDLEVVPDPADPTVNKGYYVLGSNGVIQKFGDATLADLPGIPAGFGPVVSFDLEITAGNVSGYTIMNYLGQITTWNSVTGFNVVWTDPLRSSSDPYVVDFTFGSSGELYILDEFGTVTGPGGIVNDPDAFEGLLGETGFFDIEFGKLAD